jgi:hypothetical protein
MVSQSENPVTFIRLRMAKTYQAERWSITNTSVKNKKEIASRMPHLQCSSIASTHTRYLTFCIVPDTNSRPVPKACGRRGYRSLQQNRRRCSRRPTRQRLDDNTYTRFFRQIHVQERCTLVRNRVLNTCHEHERHHESALSPAPQTR